MAPPWIRKLRLKSKPSKPTTKSDSVSPPLSKPQRAVQSEASPEVNGEQERTTLPHDPTESNISSPNPQGRIWDQAYDELKDSEPHVVEAYEKILSTRLVHTNSVSTPPENVQNEIAIEPRARSQQMLQLIHGGLDQTRKESSIKQSVEEGLQVVKTLRGLIDKAVQAAPAAAIAWPCVCLGLEILSNPMTEPGANRKGITYILSRMDWYWNLVDLLLDENKAKGTATENLRSKLENHIVQLYGKLLLYQMKSVCLYYRHWAAVIARDILKLDGWEEQLTAIKDEEAAVERDSQVYNSQNVQSYLRGLANLALEHESQLQSIEAAIRDQTRKQTQRHQNDKDEKCLRDLYETNPIEDKERIQKDGGGLLKDSYLWILNNTTFTDFCSNPQPQILWISGDPGKGKTMLLCGIIDELQKDPSITLSYFFCQATQLHLREPVSILRGLLYALIKTQPSLVSYLREVYDTTGEKLFQGSNVWISLTGILTKMLQEPALAKHVFVIDALDECVDTFQLVEFITQSLSTNRVKWIVSSRNLPEIETMLNPAEGMVRLQLELNQESVACAITSYIKYKVDQLRLKRHYDEEMALQVQQYLTDHAEGTFLWVALVCKDLRSPKVQKRHTLKRLTSIPSGIDSLYKRMLVYINDSPDAADCKHILAVSLTVYRPITLKELQVLSKPLKAYDLEELRDITRSCGSFLTLREDTVQFVHQSAKDYLMSEASNEILPCGISQQHHVLLLESLEGLSQTLKRNMYHLSSPGVRLGQFSTPESAPLEAVGYSTLYWIRHFSDSNVVDKEDERVILDFLENNYLYWLESLSLQGQLLDGVVALQILEDITRRNKLSRLEELVQDAHRFLLSHKTAIETAPLQLYNSALLFSPATSSVRRLFQAEEPNWITLKSATNPTWGDCLQTLEGHRSSAKSVAFSHDSELIVSGADDNTIRIWRSHTGECVKAITEQVGSVVSVAFSYDSNLIASASGYTVRIWRTVTGECLRTLTGHTSRVLSAAFSPDSSLMATASQDKTVRIWRVGTGECKETLSVHTDWATSVVFSQDSLLLASASDWADRTIRIWRVETSECIKVLEGHTACVNSVVFTADRTLASASADETVRIWHLDNGQCARTLTGHDSDVTSVAVSYDSTLLASASRDATVRIWRPDTGECIQILHGHSYGVNSVAFSGSLPQRLASASTDGTIRVWRTGAKQHMQTHQGHHSEVYLTVLSPDSTLVASASYDSSIRVWRTDTGECIQTQPVRDRGIRCFIRSVAISHDLTLVAAWYRRSVHIWSITTGQSTQKVYIGEVEFTARTIIPPFELSQDVLTARSRPCGVSGKESCAKMSAEVVPQPVVEAQPEGLRISKDRCWITLHGVDMIWLPKEFRPASWVTSGSTIVIGCGSGAVIILGLVESALSELEWIEALERTVTSLGSST